MRILAIRGKNLASLKGEFAIELNQPPLEQAGLFAITGHTGAGKSTLLDALCLALFDRIPRLINGANVKVGHADEDEKDRVGSNDVVSIMSRGTAVAFAEVDFIGIDKQRYQAHWEVKRARNKVTGRMQKQSVHLTNLNTDESIGQNKTDTLEEISQRIGLSFEQFRRSVLLAQGDFAAFLQARSDERSGLLERITGTEIYSQLSMAAYEQCQNEARALNQIKDKLSLEIPLDNEQRQGLKIKIAVLEDEQRSLNKSIKENNSVLDWHRTRERLNREKEHAVLSLDALKQEKAQRQPEKDQLEQVISVQPLRSLETHLEELDQKNAELKQQHQQMTYKNNSEKLEVEKLESGLQQLKKQYELKELAFETIKPELLQARELDTKIELIEKEYSVEKRQYTQSNKELAQLEDQKTDSASLERDCETIEQSLFQLKKDLDNFHIERNKISFENVNRKKEQTESALKYWRSAQDIYSSYRKNDSNINQQTEQLNNNEQLITRHTNDITLKEQEQQTLSVSLDEAKRALLLMQESVTKDAQSLRGLLNDGESCPVCGSLEHPWAGQESRLNEQYKQQKQRVSELEKSLQNTLIEINQKQQVLKNTSIESEKLQQDVNEIKNECYELVEQWQIVAKKIKLSIPFNNKEMDSYLTHEITQLNRQLEEYKAQQEQAVSLQKRIDQCLTDKEQWQIKEKQLAKVLSKQAVLDSTIANLNRQLKNQTEELSKRQKDKDALKKQRQQLLNGQNADQIESQLSNEIKQLSKQYDLQKLSLEQIKQQQISSAQTCLHLQQQLENNQIQQQSIEKQLSDELNRRSLSYETLKHLLEKNEDWIRIQTDEFKALDNRIIQAESILNERLSQLRNHEDSAYKDSAHKESSHDEMQSLLNVAPDTLQTQLKEQETLLQSLSKTLQEKIIELRQDDTRRQRQSEFQEELDSQQQRWQQWATMNDLIGSASGNKFRVFAQSLTLESLLAHANTHLNDFARRYQLQRVPGTDLDLQIIDRDMADEVRSVQSLSGGESFLVSLALALGLASLSSSRTQVESLFIDEGFGTLDQETLDIAIASLDTLQELGRKVGIISHVPILVERIGTRIVVEKLGGGQSHIKIEA